MAPTIPLARRTSTVVVLAAGKGERLNGVSVGTQPKPAIIVSGISLAEHSIRTFVQAGLARFVFVVGFEGAAVETHIETVALEYDCSVSVVIAEHWALGNGASALAARRALVEDRFLLVMCDHLLRPAMVEALLERVPKPQRAWEGDASGVLLPRLTACTGGGRWRRQVFSPSGRSTT